MRAISCPASCCRKMARGPSTRIVRTPPPDWPRVLPAGLNPNQLLGFDRITGQPLTWPLPYSITQYFAVIRGLKPGRYELRARSVDLNDIAQPEPRPIQKTGLPTSAAGPRSIMTDSSGDTSMGF